jgi:hypothetical protein
MTRIRKHGATVDVNSAGAISLTPFTGQGVTITGPLTQTGVLTQNGVVKQTVLVPLTAAQLIAMGTTPVTLIAAPGAGKCIIVDNVTFKMTTTATAFTGGGAVEFCYTNASGTKVTADIAAAVVTAAAGTSFTNVRGIEASLTGTANAAVVITNVTAPFASGTGSAEIIIEYHVA